MGGSDGARARSTNLIGTNSIGTWRQISNFKFQISKFKFQISHMESRLLAAGLRHLGLDTWRPAILESNKGEKEEKGRRYIKISKIPRP